MLVHSKPGKMFSTYLIKEKMQQFQSSETCSLSLLRSTRSTGKDKNQDDMWIISESMI